MTLSSSAPPATRVPGPRSFDVRAVVSDTRAILARGDLAVAAAALTYYAAIAVVPWVLLAIWSTTWIRGASSAESTWLGLDVLIPPDMGGRAVFDEAVVIGTGLSVLSALVLLFPASFYGEGLRRACLTFYPKRDRFTGWRSRLSILALFALVPTLAHIAVTVGGSITGLAPDGGGSGGFWDLATRVVVGFVTVWLSLAVALTWVYWKVTPGRPSLAIAGVTALVTASFIAGFAQGFLLFLSLPIDVGIPYGGLRVIGGVVAVGLWLYVLHVLVIVGWALGHALDGARVDDRVG
ncbi:YhjD/YihY/BrkB family envelope integrity protein [Gordonia amicalis]|uniref:YhjD/YihY/BrkB family envelope integrity protein n=1 Tax=Gordonia amicalis TaxID=89053 RepID=UPI0002A62234|nr:YhjD/YihY/BrkB family envelope integrity protein [Gordonia amicalis]MBA5848122.1 YihY/virulence factor BrkB family protein [Gordonia amicalis]MCZ0915162.1 YihY/virulence factor BrkB family protein [Gordonia amicalis]NKX76150.1 YihY/virulence factor BrkB family protein [Gordonia amicalis]UKO92821.1 YihY/virulence factor BrkB family protein [Gordonia amicalis]UOG19990.1 YihY/virulence factor BrkB family protein [Gordonia amicalis]